MAKNRIIIFLYIFQMGYLLGNRPLTYLMVAYLTAEFFAIAIGFTYYKIREDNHYLNHLLNIPGALLFVFLFGTIAYYLGVAVEEIPKIRHEPDDPWKPFLENAVPIGVTFVLVLIAMFVEVTEMTKKKRLDFLEREFRVQTFTVAGVIFVGLFSAIFYFIDHRIPVITMGLARLVMEIISSKKHLKLKRGIKERLTGR